MPYTDKFIATDNLFFNLNSIIVTITDPIITANFAGFIAVRAVTVYELAIKEIFNEFAIKKNKVFGDFVKDHFDRINGRIKIDDLKNNQIKRFGDKYLKKFNKILNDKENKMFISLKISIKNDYNNIITCRHEFVHKGSPTLTINEAIDSYKYGKEVINCLNDAMQR